jgi:hypothetical protein
MTHSAAKLGKPPAPQFLSWLCVSLIWGSPLVMTNAPAFGLPAGQPVVPTAVSTDSTPNQPAVLPPPIAQKLIRQVSRETYISATQLKITEIKPANFDGCLGIYRPGAMCSKILISGYQAIVSRADSSRPGFRVTRRLSPLRTAPMFTTSAKTARALPKTPPPAVPAVPCEFPLNPLVSPPGPGLMWCFKAASAVI